MPWVTSLSFPQQDLTSTDNIPPSGLLFLHLEASTRYFWHQRALYLSIVQLAVLGEMTQNARFGSTSSRSHVDMVINQDTT